MPVYYLNADFNYWNMLDWNRPDIDCLHTVNLPAKTWKADNKNDDFLDTVNLSTKSWKADNNNDDFLDYEDYGG